MELGNWLKVLCFDIYIYIYIYLFQNVFLRCPTPRLHCFLSSHWLSFRFLSFMAFLILSIQFFFGLPRAVFCFGINFNAILGNLPSAIVFWYFCSIHYNLATHFLHQVVALLTFLFVLRPETEQWLKWHRRWELIWLQKCRGMYRVFFFLLDL